MTPDEIINLLLDLAEELRQAAIAKIGGVATQTGFHALAEAAEGAAIAEVSKAIVKVANRIQR